jgi:hypothetical protein
MGYKIRTITNNEGEIKHYAFFRQTPTDEWVLLTATTKRVDAELAIHHHWLKQDREIVDQAWYPSICAHAGKGGACKAVTVYEEGPIPSDTL